MNKYFKGCREGRQDVSREMDTTAKGTLLTALKGFDISIDLLRRQNFLRRPKHLTINLNLAQIRRRYGQKPDECKDKDGANPMWPAGISYVYAVPLSLLPGTFRE